VNELLLRGYHRLPGAPRSLAASMWGLYLRAWRYGPETEQLVADALEREHWSGERWGAFREERMAAVLHKAATEVPFYRDQWARRRHDGDRSSWERLENWPILEKASVRADSRAFVADSCNVRRMFREHTSGTSGTPLVLYWSRQTVRTWYAMAEARWRRWYGVTRNDRWAILGGQLVTPAAQRRPPFWVWNAAFKQLYLSSYHLAPDLIGFYLDALKRFEITYVLGYSSSLHALAQGALRLNRRDVRLRVAVSNAEPLFDYQRAAIAEAFGCPVRETYGMAETVAAAGECEHGVLHLWPEVGEIEVVDSDRSAPSAGTGELVCTSLMNTDMPLVRYRVGDRGALGGGRACACGRTLPRLASVEGRTDDVLYTRDGRSIGRLDPVFKTQLPLLEAQIIQERLDLLRVRYVPAPGFSASAGRTLIDQLRARMGDVEVVLEEVNRLPRTAQGKFRSVICALPEAERRHLKVS
jgi:phenylacetate-CoA ligase